MIIIYIRFQSLGNNLWTEWSTILYEQKPSVANVKGYSGPLIFKRTTNGTLFLILHIAAGDTQYKGTFGKAVQLPNNGAWLNHVEYYHAPANSTDALGGYDPHLLACIPDSRGRLHFFVATSSGLFVEHFIDFSEDSTDANLTYQNHEREIPDLPKSK